MCHPAFRPNCRTSAHFWPVLISRPTEGRRMSWPGWLVAHGDGMLARRRSPILVPTERQCGGRRPGIKLTTIESQVRRPNRWTTEPHFWRAYLLDRRLSDCLSVCLLVSRITQISWVDFHTRVPRLSYGEKNCRKFQSAE